MKEMILAKTGELILKGGNRRRFQDMLKGNMKRSLKTVPAHRVTPRKHGNSAKSRQTTQKNRHSNNSSKKIKNKIQKIFQLSKKFFPAGAITKLSSRTPRLIVLLCDSGPRLGWLARLAGPRTWAGRLSFSSMTRQIVSEYQRNSATHKKNPFKLMPQGISFLGHQH